MPCRTDLALVISGNPVSTAAIRHCFCKHLQRQERCQLASSPGPIQQVCPSISGL
jgi:hypothetical protein